MKESEAGLVVMAEVQELINVPLKMAELSEVAELSEAGEMAVVATK